MGCHWQEWGECTKSCGGGMQYRYCLKGGMDKEMRRCNEQECGCIDCPTPTPPPKCTWTDWSDCSVTCGTGWQTRECTGGAHGRNQQTQYCHAEKGKRESQRCNERPCESWVPGTTPEEPGIVAPTPAPGPDECKHWNDWSKCGRSCLRCRCCADAPKYNPPRPSMPRECEHCSGGKCGKGPGPGPTWMKRKHKKHKKH